MYLRIDRVIYGTFITPISALTLPYLLVLLTHILFHEALGFKSISPLSVFIWNLGTVLFWIGGLIIAKLFLKKKVVNPFENILGLDLKIKNLNFLVLLITILFCLVLFYSLIINVLSMGYNSISTEAFATKFAGGGLFGHSLTLLRYILVYLIIVTSKKQYLTNLLILIIIWFNLLYQVKGWLLIPVISGLLIRFVLLEEKNGGLSRTFFKKTLFISVLGFGFFALSYYISLGSKVRFEFIFTHFFHYTWSGLIGFSEYLASGIKMGEYVAEIFNPINNIINKISGLPVESALNPNYFSTYIYYHKGSNVSTFIGSIFISSGPVLSVFICFFFAIVNYGIFINFLIKKTIFGLILYSFFLVGLFFGWFDFYFRHLIFYVIIIITLLFNWLIYSGRKKSF
ncbi:DUF6337 family protein [Maribacter sp. Asnod2-G09]|uniref:DUF6337 family protein n=1 Tax=Maribacter sp. Asnod2-G09 TaxID=3160577 RepID=UPI003867E518